MGYFISFDKDGNQVASVFDDHKPRINGETWFEAPKDYNGERLCVLENNAPRLLTDDEIKQTELTRHIESTAKAVHQRADNARLKLTGSTSAIKREAYQIKSNVSLLYRVGKIMVNAGVFKSPKDALNDAEIAAIQLEIKERGKNETLEQVVQIWEEKGNAYLQAACLISGKEYAAEQKIAGAKSESDIDQLSDELLLDAEQAKQNMEVIA